MSTLVDFNSFGLNDAQEPTALPAGEEVLLRIVSCKTGKDKNGGPYLLPRFEAVEYPTSKEFTKFLRVPHSDLSAKELNNAKFTLKTFCEAFDIDMTREIDPEEDFPGNEGWAILGLEETEEYGEQNFVKKFLVRR